MNAKLGGGSLFDCVHSICHLLNAESAELVVHFNYDENHLVDMTTSDWMKIGNGVHALFDYSFEMFLRNEYEIIGIKRKLL